LSVICGTPKRDAGHVLQFGVGCPWRSLLLLGTLQALGIAAMARLEEIRI